MAKSALLKSSLAKKYWMALTGLFLCLFLVLPFHGRRTDARADTEVAGTDSGAPQNFPALRIVVQVTLVAAVAFLAYYLAYVTDVFSRGLLDFLPQAPPRS